ncbi:MAG: PKD domain-containing protein, partial [Bacteroidota bacterium]
MKLIRQWRLLLSSALLLSGVLLAFPSALLANSHSTGSLAADPSEIARNWDMEPPKILFIRGGTGSGGFFEGGSDEQLADIGNFQTFGGNHGWGELADLLRGEGFEVTQVIEGPGGDSPVDLENMDLAQYDIIVFGSNNATYGAAAVNAWSNYISNGGSALFISDANFGADWNDASASDNHFLSRIGWQMNQDRGTYNLTDFQVPNHPVLEGVGIFGGEGVTPITVLDYNVPNVSSTILVRVPPGRSVGRLSSGTGRGPSTPSTANDAVLVIAEVGGGRVAGHFDRNTFFNLNGAGGRDLNKLDHKTYAPNLFNWLAGRSGGTPLNPPVANAGTDQVVTDEDNDGSELVTLDATGSSDSDGNIVNYAWTIDGNLVASGVSPTVTLPIGISTILLTVTDNDGLSSTDQVQVTVESAAGNLPPVANAGPNQSVFDLDGTGANVSLDGSGSSDPDGAIVSYRWLLGGSEIATGASPQVVLQAGVNVLTLEVTDDGDPAFLATDEVVITVLTLPNGDITNFVIVDAASNTSFRPLVVDDVIILEQSPTSISMTYEPVNSTVESVVFNLQGPVNQSQTESVPPYALAGDSNGNFSPFGFVPGDYTITATAYNANGGGGDVLETQTIDFTVVQALTTNQPPIAEAGPNQSAADPDGDGFASFTLDGSSSNDPDGNIVTYEWLIAGDLFATGVAPTVLLPVGTTTLILQVTDNEGATATDEVVLTVTPNQPPTAEAGENQEVRDADGNGLAEVALDGTGSIDPDGSLVSYSWTIADAEIATGPSPVVSLPTGEHLITLTVQDNGGATATDQVTVIVTTNQLPVANAGANQSAGDPDGDGFASFTLDGSSSNDPDGNLVSYEWLIAGDLLATGIAPTVLLPVGTTTLILQVTDNESATATDEVVLTVTPNQPPTAEAGENQEVRDADGNGLADVTLDGTGSSDPDG